MSRYTLADAWPFAEVLFGWDPSTSSFFVQCFDEEVPKTGATTAEDEGNEVPTIWLSGLTLHQTVAELHALGLTLPDLAQRVLFAEATASHPALRRGDPVIWRIRTVEQLYTGIVIDVRPGQMLVQHPEGTVWLGAHELKPDLIAVGVE